MTIALVRINPMAPNEIGQRILSILQTKGWSQRELARRAGLPSQTHVNTLIKQTGDSASVATVRKIAEALGVRPEWLTSGEGDEQPDASHATGEAETATPREEGHLDVPQFGSLRSWPGLLKGAKQIRPNLPGWVWIHVERQRPQLSAEPTVSAIAKIADLTAEHESPPPPGEDPRKYWDELAARTLANAMRKLG